MQRKRIMRSYCLLVSMLLMILTPLSASPLFRSAEDLPATVGYDKTKNGDLIATIGGPPGWAKVFGLAYHDGHNMLYAARGGSNPNSALAYGAYSGGTSVTWVEFDNAEFVSGLGCYENDQLFAITQSSPAAPVPYYLYTWQLDGSGIPILPPDVYELGAPFTGGMGGCEWDGDYLWMVDQNWESDGNGIIYKYDVTAHSVISSWFYGELGAFGIACVWDAGSLNIWISDWYGGNKLAEHSDTGTPSGLTYDVSISPNDIAYKYETDFDGPGLFVSAWGSNVINLYDHYLSNLESNTWGAIKAGFI